MRKTCPPKRNPKRRLVETTALVKKTVAPFSFGAVTRLDSRLDDPEKKGAL